jgi:hypothetical protein
MKTSIKILALTAMLLVGQFSTLMADNKGPSMKDRLRKEVMSQVAFPKEIASGTEQKVNVSFTVDENGIVKLIHIDSKEDQLKKHISKELNGIKLLSKNYLVGVEYKMSINFIAE